MVSVWQLPPLYTDVTFSCIRYLSSVLQLRHIGGAARVLHLGQRALPHGDLLLGLLNQLILPGQLRLQVQRVLSDGSEEVRRARQ